MRISGWSSDVCSSDLAHPRLDDCVFPPGVLGTGSIVVAEEACPALLLRRLRQDCHEAEILLRSRRYPAFTRPDILREKVFRSEEHTSELQSLMRISYAVFCLKKKKEYQ